MWEHLRSPKSKIQRFSLAILTEGFKQSTSDYSLFTKGKVSSFISLLVYVDDIIITGPSTHSIDSLKGFLNDHFKRKDLGSLKYFLGLEIAKSSRGLVFSQQHYTLQFANVFPKPLPSSLLFPLLSKMSVKDIYSPSWGGVLDVHLWKLISIYVNWLAVA